MTTEPRADRPVPASQDALNTMAASLPDGAQVLIGIKASPDVDAPTQAGPCFTVIYAADDHTIHAAGMCGGGTSYEIVSDDVVGSW